MALFQSYIMVDWSAGSGRQSNREHSIWIAHGSIRGDHPETRSPPSRSEAVEQILSLIQASVRGGRRVLVCFDFAYGYSEGFAKSLQAATGIAGSPRIAVWEYLSSSLNDDLGTPQGGRPTNRSNRFDVANQVNSMMSTGTAALGPFWCAGGAASHPYIPQNRPHQPFMTAQGYLVKPRRLTDQRARSDTPFRLFGTGSVGSQSLTGIPRLLGLRNDDRLKSISAVWPFETGWATGDTWLKATLCVHAEIYPSIGKPEQDTIKDRGQVRAMWKWVHDLDHKDELWRKFSLPTGIAADSKEDITIRSEEGWILGCDDAIA